MVDNEKLREYIEKLKDVGLTTYNIAGMSPEEIMERISVDKNIAKLIIDFAKKDVIDKMDRKSRYGVIKLPHVGKKRTKIVEELGLNIEKIASMTPEELLKVIPYLRRKEAEDIIIAAEIEMERFLQKREEFKSDLLELPYISIRRAYQLYLKNVKLEDIAKMYPQDIINVLPDLKREQAEEIIIAAELKLEEKSMKIREFLWKSPMTFKGELINGKSVMNGRSIVNGLINGNEAVALRRVRHSIGRKISTALYVISIILIIMFLFSMFNVSSNALQGVNWDKIGKYSDFDLSHLKNSNINITSFSFFQNKNEFYFYLRFAGFFSSSNDYKNLAYIMIDNDSSKITGYNASYLGADYLISLTGYNGKVFGYLFKFNGTTNEQWAWRPIENVRVQENGHEISGFVAKVFNDSCRIIVVAENGYNEDITPVVGIKKPSLLVIQHPINTGLEIRLIPLYNCVNVRKISLYLKGDISIKNPQVLENIGNISRPKNIVVKVDISAAKNETVYAKVDNIISNTSYVTIWGYGFKKYVGTHRGIIIDGVFDDWKSLPKKSSSMHVENPNIDVENYANTTYSGNNYFYRSVKGAMLNGNIAPEIERLKPSGGGAGNVSGEKPAPKYPYDYAEIDFITIDGKTHKIEIWGYNGNVIGITLDGKPAGNSVKVGVGRDGKYGALEVELHGNYKIKSYRISMTDWGGLQDVISVRSLNYGPPIPPIPEFSLDPAIIPLLIMGIEGIRRFTKKKSTKYKY